MAVSRRLRFEILRRDRFRCHYCGFTAADAELRVDHVIPEALGGTDDPSNLVTACDPCNSGKSSIAPDAAIVAAVARDADRWARAIEIVAATRTTKREQLAATYGRVESTWKSWKCGDGTTDPLPHDWYASVDQFIAAGLTTDDICELVSVAMRSRATDKWRYLCGCCWTRVRETHSQAAVIIAGLDANDGTTGAAVDAVSSLLYQVGTRYPPADIERLGKAQERVLTDWGLTDLFRCEHGVSPHCGDLICRAYFAGDADRLIDQELTATEAARGTA